MKRFIAVFIGVALVLLCATPALAAGFSLSPAEVEFDVPADGSTTVEFLVYDFGGDLEISLEDIPLRVEPQTVNVSASAEGTPVELTFYGDESLGSQVFKGMIVFLASSGGNIAFGVKVKATVNQIAAGEPLPQESPPEESSPPEQIPTALPEEAPVAIEAPPEEAPVPTEQPPASTPAPAPAPSPPPVLPQPAEGEEFPIVPVAGIAAGVAIVITLIVVLVRRRER